MSRNLLLNLKRVNNSDDIEMTMSKRPEDIELLIDAVGDALYQYVKEMGEEKDDYDQNILGNTLCGIILNALMKLSKERPELSSSFLQALLYYVENYDDYNVDDTEETTPQNITLTYKINSKIKS